MSTRAFFAERLRGVLAAPLTPDGNFVVQQGQSPHASQQHTNDVFSEKWQKYEQTGEQAKLYEFQRAWYLKLYGFASEAELATFLRAKPVIFDAGCGLGYKAAWFAGLAPGSLVIGMDFSDAARQAGREYGQFDNLFFIQGDIAATGFAEGSVDYVSCDQVIMHTEDPRATFRELARITAEAGELACYFYAKKALPRELLDDHFRSACLQLGREELWAMSQQLTELGRRLSELNVSFEAPDIPALGIKGGRYDVQRFIYWNFLRCFWNPQLGWDTSLVTNFDWYSPSNAERFSEAEVRDIVAACGMAAAHFHAEEACYSGRFRRGVPA